MNDDMVHMEYNKQEIDAFRLEIEQQQGMILSSGTMRPGDLIEAFFPIVERVDPRKAAELKRKYGDVFIYMYSPEYSAGIGDGWFYDDDNLAEAAGWLVGDLFDLLNEYGPDAYHFSASEGDGACYGYFLDERIAAADYEINDMGGSLDIMDAWEILQEHCIDVDDIADLIRERLTMACYEDCDLAEYVVSRSDGMSG